MDTDHHRPAWGIAVAAFVLTLATACGADVASAPANIGDPGERLGQPAQPQPGSADQQCQGAPQQGGFVCRTDPPAPGAGSADDRRSDLPDEPVVPAPAPPVYLGV